MSSQLFDRRRLARVGSKAKAFVSNHKRGLKTAAYVAAGAALLGTALAMGRRKKSGSRSVSRRSSRKSSSRKKSKSRRSSSRSSKSKSRSRSSKRRR